MASFCYQEKQQPNMWQEVLLNQFCFKIIMIISKKRMLIIKIHSRGMYITLKR